MAYEFKWHECNVLFTDDKMEDMGIDERIWFRSMIDLNKVVGFSEWEDDGERGVQLFISGALSVIIDTLFDDFKELLE